MRVCKQIRFLSCPVGVGGDVFGAHVRLNVQTVSAGAKAILTEILRGFLSPLW
jgi:hypothetical protein